MGIHCDWHRAAVACLAAHAAQRVPLPAAPARSSKFSSHSYGWYFALVWLALRCVKLKYVRMRMQTCSTQHLRRMPCAQLLVCAINALVWSALKVPASAALDSNSWGVYRVRTTICAFDPIRDTAGDVSEANVLAAMVQDVCMLRCVFLASSLMASLAILT